MKKALMRKPSKYKQGPKAGELTLGELIPISTVLIWDAEGPTANWIL